MPKSAATCCLRAVGSRRRAMATSPLTGSWQRWKDLLHAQAVHEGCRALTAYRGACPDSSFVPTEFTSAKIEGVELGIGGFS